MSDSPETPALPDFTPVPRKNSVTHGWTAAKQRGFIAALAATGSVRLATQAVGMSHCGVYKLRIAPGGESFAAAWDAAVTRGADQIRDVLIDQAINGVPEPIIHAGKQVAERRRFNHRTMMWVLQHHKPDEYPGGKTTHRRGWDEADAQATVIAEWAATRERLEGRLRMIHERYMTEESSRSPTSAPPMRCSTARSTGRATGWRFAEQTPGGATLVDGRPRFAVSLYY